MKPCSILELLKPEDLPRNHKEIKDALTNEAKQALAIGARISPRSSDQEAHAHLCRALRLIPKADRSPKPGRRRRVVPKESDDEHDHYTRIVRVSAPIMNILVRSNLQAYRELMEEALQGGTSLSKDEWVRLRTAFTSMLHYLSEAPRESEGNASALSPTQSPFNGQLNPLRRWLIGHHVFAALIQGIIVTLNCFANAIRLRDLQSADSDLNIAAVLMSGSGLALRFTGDFGPDEYDSVVRPTMMPPQSPPRMSGIMAMDHRYLIKTLRGMKEVFVNLDPGLNMRHLQFFSAFKEAYEAHGYVCEHFRGNERPSLLSADSSESAVTALDKLKHARLEILKPSSGISGD